MNIIYLDSTDSTNQWLSQNHTGLQYPALVWCHTQTAGRGQRGNYWESQPGKNITASLYLKHENFPAERQFQFSELIALTIIDFLETLGIKANVKWPNDIYVGDKKICGILIEHSVLGKFLSYSIAGFGININQEIFHSDAPNPVSVKMIGGKETDLVAAVNLLGDILTTRLKNLDEFEKIHKEFLSKLWRNDSSFYNFYDKNAAEKISAKVEDIGLDGLLSLRLHDNTIRQYAFKEIEYII